jgi:hypothetical protein
MLRKVTEQQTQKLEHGKTTINSITKQPQSLLNKSIRIVITVGWYQRRNAKTRL